MSRPRLHGTDGIRGKVVDSDGSENPIENLIFQRELSASAMRIAGNATGVILCKHVANIEHSISGGHVPLVVVGWDRRPRNAELVDALERGLVDGGCRVQRVGEVPTPGLHHCLLESGADGGMMVTASHNPASDSGVKLFDHHDTSQCQRWRTVSPRLHGIWLLIQLMLETMVEIHLSEQWTESMGCVPIEWG